METKPKTTAVSDRPVERELLLVDPAELRLHALQKHIPAPDKKSSEWAAFVDSVQAGGILHPLIITPDKQIMDGGWRWRAARELEHTEVPCVVRSESEAAVIITESLLHRKQMTRGAAVYLALSLVKDFVSSSESRRLSNLRAGRKTREIPLFSPKSSNSPSENIEGLCQRWGVGHDTYNRARQLHEIFATKPDLKKLWEPRLLSGEKNLWNVLSAIGGAGADQGARDRGVITGQLELFGNTFENLRKGVSGWKRFDPQMKQIVLRDWARTVKAMPDDLREAMIEALEVK